jgi:hypothetical protein
MLRLKGIRLNVKLDERAVAIALDYVDVERQSDGIRSSSGW